MCWYEQLGRIDIDYAATNEPVTNQWRGTISNAKSITNLDSGTYSVVISDTFGCADSMSYRINKFFPIIKTGRDTTIHRGTRAFLWVTKTQSQSWYGDAILTSPSRQTIFVNPIVDTFYTVDAIDINGCDNNDTVWVWVITPPDYKIQNIISPNGDGKNETWNLTPLDELNQFRITIMDRQGALIYQTEDYQNDWKAETADGTPLPNGVYYFHLQHLKKPIVHKGFIQVIR
jgi:gliding motility-associated-like protein